MENDSRYMAMALEEAVLAGAAGNVPVGAVVVLGDEVIGRGRNRRRSQGDPTAHAEIEALRQAAKAVGNWRVEAELYVTQEPCPMCAGAIVNARLTRLIYGCDSPKSGAIKSLFQLASDPRLNHRVEITTGVMATECGRLLTEFFQALRTRESGDT